MSEELPADSSGLDKDTIKRAFKAFKKRLKLTRLDEESKVSQRPTTGGQASNIVAIMPPTDFPSAVWEELVKRGKLKKAKHGMYELGEDA